jgi:hypothetical protein
MIWLLTPPPPASPVNKLDRRNTGRQGKRDKLLTGERGGGVGRGAESCNLKKAWSSTNHSLLSGTASATTRGFHQECGVCSVADPGCLSRILSFSIPDPGSKRFPDPHLHQRIYVFQPIVSKLSKIWSGMFIPDLDFWPIPDPGSRDQKGTGSRICNTGCMFTDAEKLRYLPPAVVAGQPPLRPLSELFPGHPAPPSGRRPRSYLRWKKFC